MTFCTISKKGIRLHRTYVLYLYIRVRRPTHLIVTISTYLFSLSGNILQYPWQHTPNILVTHPPHTLPHILIYSIPSLPPYPKTPYVRQYPHHLNILVHHTSCTTSNISNSSSYLSAQRQTASSTLHSTS